jgi:hypothetical protein
LVRFGLVLFVFNWIELNQITDDLNAFGWIDKKKKKRLNWIEFLNHLFEKKINYPLEMSISMRVGHSPWDIGPGRVLAIRGLALSPPPDCW